ncbi:uncharacterized protein BDZ99DRAFT_479633 [Mytilinidion resinicola]|uniref:Uncharacterized protein n=1 Tax=Mytilinidion resinicola TaxID=574789 RepID=A0A6A6YE65_9PEZI|nr:uncharacterized protein BDZ99DRAFT_479633 [Mytilinidion resinicola]KAF2806375.1 hypothetical protein BDZ99DRAFT_479633 [Mytilinidion resinicola]
MDHPVFYDQFGQVYASQGSASSSTQPSDTNHVEPAYYWPPFETPGFTTPAFVNAPAFAIGSQPGAVGLDSADFHTQVAMSGNQTNFNMNSMPIHDSSAFMEAAPYDSSDFMEATTFGPQPGLLDFNPGVNFHQYSFQNLSPEVLPSMQQADSSLLDTQLGLGSDWPPLQDPHRGASCTTPFAMPFLGEAEVAHPTRSRGLTQPPRLSEPAVPNLGDGGAEPG